MNLIKFFFPSYWRDRLSNQTVHILARIELLDQLLNNKMSTVHEAIAAFASRQTAFNTQLLSGLDDVKGLVVALEQKISEIQASDGQITVEDQATLDSMESLIATSKGKVDEIKALTPPTLPVVTPPSNPPAETVDAPFETKASTDSAV